tara:strand:+ start:77179 stop:77946 length:768 start_codon:yes stop_codon:yes gene_type:complete
MPAYFFWRAILILFLSALLIAPWAIFWQQSYQSSLPIYPIPEDATEARKAHMVNNLLPAIQRNNRALLKQREKAHKLFARAENNRDLRKRELKWLNQQGKHYRLPETEAPDVEWLSLLLRRLDIIPADLALAQAAMESAWGTSRFATEGDNYFGQWCFSRGCGIVPSQRPAGASYEVETFDSVEDSVQRYMLNLNSHPRYTQLRLLREAQRKEQRPVDGQELAAGLHGYSAIGDTYIRTLRALIRANDFQRFDNH